MTPATSEPTPGMRSLLRFLTFAAVIIVGIIAFYFVRQDGVNAGAQRERRLDARLPVLESLDSEFSSLVDRVLPSVVSISAETQNPAVERMRRIRRMLGMGDPGQAEPELGSGVIVSPEGHILTNLHVISRANRVEVQLSDGRVFAAKLLGYDSQVDIAVLKIDAADLPALPFADSNAAKIGQIVFAIGNPLGLQETVTQGIISGKGRRAISDVSTDFLQTDAAINPGNSGGPLVDVRGRILGISNAVLLEGAGISFAIPSNVALRVYEDVVKRGRISRPFFGAITWPLNAQTAAELGLGISSGNLVMSVMTNSPAERAGIQVGDVIYEFDGQPVRDSDDIRYRFAEAREGDRIVVGIWRNGAQLKIPVTLESQPLR